MSFDVAAAYDALLLDVATGAASGAERLLVRAHLELQPVHRVDLALAEALGGVFLERSAVIQPWATPALPGGAGPAKPVARPEPALHALLSALAGARPKWRPGVREYALPVDGARGYLIPAGGRMPMHGHDGDEVTLVLRGAFEDGHGVYREGDLAFADAGVEHAPRVIGDQDCLCVVAMGGPLRFRCPLTRMAAKVFS